MRHTELGSVELSKSDKLPAQATPCNEIVMSRNESEDLQQPCQGRKFAESSPHSRNEFRVTIRRRRAALGTFPEKVGRFFCRSRRHSSHGVQPDLVAGATRLEGHPRRTAPQQGRLASPAETRQPGLPGGDWRAGATRS